MHVHIHTHTTYYVSLVQTRIDTFSCMLDFLTGDDYTNEHVKSKPLLYTHYCYLDLTLSVYVAR